MADLRGADMTGATTTSATLKNTLWTDGSLKGFSMTSSADSFTVSAYTTAGGENIGAKITEGGEIVGGAVLTIGEGSSLDLSAGTLLSVRDGGGLVLSAGTELRLHVDGEDSSLLTVGESGGVTFADGAKIVIDLLGAETGDSFSLVTWTDASTMSDLSSLEKGSGLLLFSDGSVLDDDAWYFSTDGNALTVTLGAKSEITISSEAQSVDLPYSADIGTFDSDLREFRGSISGAGTVPKPTRRFSSVADTGVFFLPDAIIQPRASISSVETSA